MKKRIKLPDPGPADLEPGEPWMLSKNITTGKCKCINTDIVIPNVASFFIIGTFKERQQCVRRIKDCNRRQI